MLKGPAFGKFLKRRAVDAGVSNTQLAEKAGVSLQAVGQWFSKGRISRESLRAIAPLLRSTVDDLLSGVTEPLVDQPNEPLLQDRIGDTLDMLRDCITALPATHWPLAIDGVRRFLESAVSQECVRRRFSCSCPHRPMLASLSSSSQQKAQRPYGRRKMTHRRCSRSALLVLLFPLAADAATVSAAEAVKRAKADIVRDFKDPVSAQWENVYLNRREDGTHVVCGKVNGKNSFGGYVGFRQFYAGVSMEKDDFEATMADMKRMLSDAESRYAAATGGQPARPSTAIDSGSSAAFATVWIEMCANGKRTYVK